jgi:DNA end-binding protein Ku
MYFANEIRRVAGYGETEKHVKLKPPEIKLAEQLMETLSKDFKPEQYHDTFQERLKALIEAKMKGKTIRVEEAARAPVIDMMEALKRSLAKTAAVAGKKRPLRATGTERSRRKLAS